VAIPSRSDGRQWSLIEQDGSRESSELVRSGRESNCDHQQGADFYSTPTGNSRRRKRMRTKKVVAAALLAASGAASAFNVGTPATFSRLIWTFTSAAYPGCPQLSFDATGDLVNGNALSIAGTLNCTDGSGYVLSGGTYLGRDGSMNIMFTAGGFTTFCPRVVGYTGTCTTHDWAGNVKGNGNILLQ
jgi:hypothetical protein